MIACPKCHAKAEAYETRTVHDYVRRRRVCRVCGERVTTVEVIVQEGPRGNSGYADARLVPLRDLEAMRSIIERAAGIKAPDQLDAFAEPEEPEPDDG